MAENNLILETNIPTNLKNAAAEVSVIIPVMMDITYFQLYSSVKSSVKSCEALSNNYEIVIVSEMTEFADDLMSIKNMSKLFKNVYYIIKRKTGLAECLNVAIDMCSGKNILVTYPNSKMDSNRAYTQVSLLRDNDIVCLSTESYKYDNTHLTLLKLYNGLQVCSGGFGITRNAYNSLPVKFESYYDDCISKVCATMLNRKTSSKIFLSSEYAGFCLNVDPRNFDQIVKTYRYIRKGADLTCVVPFRNEYEEVEKTVESIRATTNYVDIILINDCPDDDFDYESIAKQHRCKYVKHKTSMGSAYSKNEGALLSKTPYFILLDAHVRFYQDNWDRVLVKTLEDNPNCIVCLNTLVIRKDGKYALNDIPPSKFKLDKGTTGARIIMHGKDVYDLKWITSNQFNDSSLCYIPAVLGASYSSSIHHWRNIGGYKGLRGFGFEEPFISLKTWMIGGKCLLLKNYAVGHYYRDKAPYNSPYDEYTSNRVFLANWFMSQEEYDEFCKENKNTISKQAFAYANEKIEEMKADKAEFQTKIKVPYSRLVIENDNLIPKK